MFKLRFFEFNDESRGDCGTHLLDVKASEIPKKGHLVYLGDLNDAVIYKIKRVVRSYSSDERDIAANNGDSLTSVEIEVVATTVGL